MAPFANMQQTLSDFRSKVFAKSTKLNNSAQASDTKQHSYSASVTATSAPFEHLPASRRLAPTKPRSLMFGDLNLFGKPDAKWRKWVTFGIPVDTWAKFILTMNMFEAGLAVLEGITNFVAQRVFNTAFWSVFNATLCVWGFLIGAIAMYGFCILWGSWRKSVTAVHVFSFMYAFMISLFLAASVLWFTFAINSTPKMQKNCLNLQVTFSGQKFAAPLWFKEICLESLALWHSWQIAWGIVNLVQTYFGIVLVIWATDLKRRLVREERWRSTDTAGTEGAWDSSASDADEKSHDCEQEIPTPYCHTPYIEDAQSVNLSRGAMVTIVRRNPEHEWEMPALPMPTIGAAMRSSSRIISATSFSSAMIPIQLDIGSAPNTPRPLPVLDHNWQRFSQA